MIFDNFIYFKWVESYSTYAFVTSLTLLIITFPGFIHAETYFLPFLMLHDIQLYIYSTFSLSIHLSWIPHVGYCDKHGCANYLFEILLWIFFYIYPEEELLDHMVILFLIFWQTIILFSTMATAFTFPPRTCRSSSIFISLPTLGIFCSFDSAHPDGCVVISHMVLICISLMIGDVEHLFVWLTILLSLEKYLFQVFCPF